MILTTVNQSIEAVSDGAATTTEPQVFADYIDVDTAQFKMVGAGPQATNLNGATTVDILSPPAIDINRHPKYINIFNADTVEHQITVKFDDNGTEYILLQTTLQSGQTISWTREGGWSDNADLLSIFDTDNVFNGTNEFAKLIAGDPGTEGSGINVGGTTYESVLKASDIGGTNVAQAILHRHSTTLAPVLVTARSHSDTSSHTIVSSGDQLFRLVAVGWDGTNYERGAEIRAVVDATPGANDMPTRWDFMVSPDGSATPATQFSIHENGELECVGIPTLPTYTVAGVPSAATYARGLIYVSDETGGAIPAFSDGTNWRRVTDRAIVS